MAESKLAEILLIEDNEGDVELTRDAFEVARFRNTLNVVRDGAQALDYFYKRGEFKLAPTPDIVLLDLNMPKVNGREVLEQIKGDPDLKHIPIIILTSSKADEDILSSYNLHANCYITKPVNAEKFMKIIQQVKDFWIDIVRLPSRNQ